MLGFRTLVIPGTALFLHLESTVFLGMCYVRRYGYACEEGVCVGGVWSPAGKRGIGPASASLVAESRHSCGDWVSGHTLWELPMDRAASVWFPDPTSSRVPGPSPHSGDTSRIDRERCMQTPLPGAQHQPWPGTGDPGPPLGMGGHEPLKEGLPSPGCSFCLMATKTE